MDEDAWWLLIGCGGQCLFLGRFIVQWLASERARRSVVPVAFWYLSIAGALVLLAYAFHRGDPVFAAGQGVGIALYLRNLCITRRACGRSPDPAAPDKTTPGAGPRSRPGTGSVR